MRTGKLIKRFAPYFRPYLGVLLEEQGSHKELISGKGMYYNLYKMYQENSKQQ